MKKHLSILLSLFLLIPRISYAHCPLCTVGAGALAVAAAYLGISSMIVGVLIGAFALALGMWLAKMPKKKYFPEQFLVLTTLIFFSTVIPIMPLVKDYAPLYIPFLGEYGKTYAVNLFLAGLPFGMIALLIAPYLSKKLSDIRQGRLFPFQGIIITLLLLVTVSLIIQLS